MAKNYLFQNTLLDFVDRTNIIQQNHKWGHEDPPMANKTANGRIFG